MIISQQFPTSNACENRRGAGDDGIHEAEQFAEIVNYGANRDVEPIAALQPCKRIRAGSDRGVYENKMSQRLLNHRPLLG